MASAGLETASRPKGAIAWMAGHTVAANLLMVVILVGGLILGSRIEKEVFPDYELDLVSITVPYPGASPEEVERGIVLAIEEAVQGLEGIKEVTASASEGLASVTVEMIAGEDIQRLAQDIQGEVDRITSFPEDAEEPRVTVAQRRRSVVSLALFGNQGERVLREVAEDIRDRLVQDPDISQVDFEGVRFLEISIEIPQGVLRTYNLTLEQVADRIRRTSVELPGGAIRTEGGDVLVRMKERRDFGHQFGRIPIITGNDGTQVFLEDIAVIRDGFEETDRFATYDGQPAVMIEVYRVGAQTPVSVSDAVQRQMELINPNLPPGLSRQARAEDGGLDLPRPAEGDRRWTLLLVSDSGRLIRVRHVRGWITLLAALPLLSLAIVAGAYLRSDCRPGGDRPTADARGGLQAPGGVKGDAADPAPAAGSSGETPKDAARSAASPAVSAGADNPGKDAEWQKMRSGSRSSTGAQSSKAP